MWGMLQDKQSLSFEFVILPNKEKITYQMHITHKKIIININWAKIGLKNLKLNR